MTFAELIAAAEAGAASVYHAIVATGEEVISWENSPLVAPLVSVGVASANAMLTRAGVNGSVITSDVSTALKAIAAHDATVPSIGSISALVKVAGAVATALDPAAAAVVGTVEGIAGVAETLLVSASHPVVPAAGSV